MVVTWFFVHDNLLAGAPCWLLRGRCRSSLLKACLLLFKYELFKWLRCTQTTAPRILCVLPTERRHSHLPVCVPEGLQHAPYYLLYEQVYGVSKFLFLSPFLLLTWFWLFFFFFKTFSPKGKKIFKTFNRRNCISNLFSHVRVSCLSGFMQANAFGFCDEGWARLV